MRRGLGCVGVGVTGLDEDRRQVGGVRLELGPCHIGDMWGHGRCDRSVIAAPGLVVFGRADATPLMITVSKPVIVSRSRARAPIFPYPDAPSGGIRRTG